MIGSIAAALALLACAVLIVPGALRQLAEQRQAFPSASRPSTAATTAAATSAPTRTPPGPFTDTPAASYPVGAAGITLPGAVAVGVFPEPRVARALQQVKRGLIAARLDRTMLVNHDTSVLLGLLAPDARDSIEQDFAEGTFVSFASQIAPGPALAPEEPRVKGRITVRATENDDGIRLLEVVTNFVWVYPFVAVPSEPGNALVIVHDQVSWLFPADADVARSSRGMWIGAADSYASNIDCDLLDRGLLTLGEPPSTGDDTGADETLFDPDRSLDIEGTC